MLVNNDRFLEIHFPFRYRLIGTFIFRRCETQGTNALFVSVFLEQIDPVVFGRSSDRFGLRFVWRNGQASQEFTVGRKLLNLRSLDYPTRAVAPRRAGTGVAIRF